MKPPSPLNNIKNTLSTSFDNNMTRKPDNYLKFTCSEQREVILGMEKKRRVLRVAQEKQKFCVSGLVLLPLLTV